MNEIVQTLLRAGWIRTHKSMRLLLSVCWLLLSFSDPNNIWEHTSVLKISTTDVTGHVPMHRQHGLFQHPHKHQQCAHTPEHSQPRILLLLCLNRFETNQWNMHILPFSWLTKPPQFMGFKSDIHAWTSGCLASHCLRPWVLLRSYWPPGLVQLDSHWWIILQHTSHGQKKTKTHRKITAETFNFI